MSKEVALGIFSNLGTQTPVLLVLLAGAGYAVMHRRRHPTLSVVVAVVAVALASSILLTFLVFSALPLLAHQYAATLEIVRWYRVVAVAQSVMFWVFHAVLLACAFAGRRS